ncbi:MAG: PIN domain-containing protein [Rhodospirillales bacterium]|nr:PIN domain-containing protein [Rhodospirillales bacterium]
MKLLVDTNVVLDLLLDRSPFVHAASDIFGRIERGEISGFLAATTVTTIHYLAMKAIGGQAADKAIERLLTLFDVAPITRLVLQSALSAKYADFEDAVVHEAARYAALDGIVTRDVAGFRNATLPIYQPDELLGMLAAPDKGPLP